ncbi:Six-hairpin glycosidase-like protein [Daedaleopsis nitida]|nr:Six-hairpin glycosidase-like protein [Daedaleopsis nitida]
MGGELKHAFKTAAQGYSSTWTSSAPFPRSVLPLEFVSPPRRPTESDVKRLTMRLLRSNSNLAFTLWVVALVLAGHVAALASHGTSYSTLMATSIISRAQGVLAGTGDRSELLQAGVTQKAFQRLLEQYPDCPSAPLISAYVARSADSVIATVSDAFTDTAYPLDRLSSGDALIVLYEKTGNETYRGAFEALHTSIGLQKKNAEGGLWYYVYPEWSYLDGMASLAPFWTLYADHFERGHQPGVVDSVVRQMELLWQHCRTESGLLVHGYDESKTAVWADPETGASPIVWGRSLGWYALALADTLELLPREAVRARLHLTGRFKELAAAVVRAVDENTGAWWQVVDQPGREGNYIESSASAMFAYSLLKGLRLGYLEERVWTHVATRAYEYVVDNFVIDTGNGTLGYNGTVSVCSLNSTASYEYYIGQSILYNSVLGSAAFILASLEYEHLVTVAAR